MPRKVQGTKVHVAKKILGEISSVETEASIEVINAISSNLLMLAMKDTGPPG